MTAPQKPAPSGPKWWILGLGALLLLPLVYVLYSGFGNDPHAIPDTRTGTPAPDFALHTLDGEPVVLKELRGFPVVLNFWATDCQGCIIEHANLVKAGETYGPQGVVFLGVLYNDSEKLAKAFLKQKGSSYPTLLDPDGRTAVDYGVTGIPETYFIDKQGMIVHKAAYPLSWPELVERLEALK